MTTPKKGESFSWFSEPVVVTSDAQMMVEITGPGGTTYVPVDQLKPAVDWATLKARELVEAEYERCGNTLAAAQTRSGERDCCPDVAVLANYMRANHLTVERVRDALHKAGPYTKWAEQFTSKLHAALTGEKE